MSSAALVVTNHLITVLDELSFEGSEINMEQDRLIAKCSLRMSEEKSACYPGVAQVRHRKKEKGKGKVAAEIRLGIGGEAYVL